MSNVPDAWDDNYSLVADAPGTSSTKEGSSTAAAAPSKKQTKAQKRAQQAEFNRQLWAEAEGPRHTNYFLDSRNDVPLKSEFKPPPVLLSRRGPPIVQQQRLRNQTLGDGLQNLSLGINGSNNAEESEDDEDELERQRLERELRQEQAKRDREEKQRKYEERRQELFGTPSSGPAVNGGQLSKSGASSPNSATPPGSRSQTPNRGRGRGSRGAGRGNSGAGRGGGQLYYQQQQQQQQQQSVQHYANYHRQQSQKQPTPQQALQPQQQQQQQELFEPMYAPRPGPAAFERREKKDESAERPIRQSRGPDGSGRAGFGFLPRGGKA